MLAGEAPGDPLHFRMRLRLSDPVFQASHYQKPIGVVVDLFRPERQRSPQLGLKPIIQAGRRNAYHRIWLAIHSNLLADDPAVGVEVSIPKAVAQYYDALFANLALFRQETAANKHWVPGHTKKAGRIVHAVDLFGSFRSGDVKGSPCPCLDVLERLAASLPYQIIGYRRAAAPIRSHCPDHHQLLRFRIGHGFEQSGVNYAEDSRGRADAQRQRQHGHRGEAWVLQQRPCAVAQVPPQVSKHGSSPFFDNAKCRANSQFAQALTFGHSGVPGQTDTLPYIEPSRVPILSMLLIVVVA